MNVTETCAARREELLGMWVEKFIGSYPLQSAGFVRTNADPFANPVGSTTRRALSVLFDAVIGLEASPRDVKIALGDLIRLRAIQDFNPSQAVGPLFLLKGILRDALFNPKAPEQKGSAGQKVAVEKPYAVLPSAETLNGCLEVEDRLDSLALLALDLYSDDRERIFRMRVNEVKRSQSSLVRLLKQKGVDTEAYDAENGKV